MFGTTHGKERGGKGKGSAKDQEVAGAGPVHCHFSLPSLSLPFVVPNVVFHLGCHGTQTILISISDVQNIN